MSTETGTTLPLTARTLTGFGRTAPSVAQVLSTPDVEVIADAVKRVADASNSDPAYLAAASSPAASAVPTATMPATAAASSST